jgi:hypothetical protein
MNRAPSPVLQAIVGSAVDATGAQHGWIVAELGGVLVVVAAAGEGEPAALLGHEVPSASQTGFTIGSGQPAARQPPPSDDQAAGTAGFPGVPPTLLSVPCTDGLDGTNGALELAGKRGGAFTVDDIELATLLAEVAGAALAEAASDRRPVASPDVLAADLRRAAETDPGRYALAAAAVQALLGTS